MNSEVGGILSAISNMNTENANKTVNPRVTFSPLADGRRNPVKDNIDNITQGMITLKE